MRLVRFERGGKSDWGALRGDEEIVSLGQLGADPGAVLERPVGELEREAERGSPIARSEVRLLAPIRPVRNVLCLGLNYVAHVDEAPADVSRLPKAPVWFTKATTSLVDPEADVVLDPELTSQLDWEVELAVVLRRGGRRIPEERALDHVYGYTVLNDLSARDLQFARGGQWFLGKSLDGLCPLGPWLVTADEIPDPQALTVCLRVNGEERQRASTRDMIFSVAASIADISRGVTLLPGDIIATGTPSGVALGMRPPPWLKDGDVVEAEVDAIGVLQNRIVVRRPD
jgi:2-keto-4-pentenoate hydratase/2-oxohepta-3-ene-1,7-dioic acid hydratase in catechol pathway